MVGRELSADIRELEAKHQMEKDDLLRQMQAGQWVYREQLRQASLKQEAEVQKLQNDRQRLEQSFQAQRQQWEWGRQARERERQAERQERALERERERERARGMMLGPNNGQNAFEMDEDMLSRSNFFVLASH